LEQSKGCQDEQRRNAIFAEMETILTQKEFPVLPIYYYVNQGLLRDTISGWFPNVQDIHPLKYIRKNEKFD
jgi:oligopeptide transport system substrate-binding protein